MGILLQIAIGVGIIILCVGLVRWGTSTLEIATGNRARTAQQKAGQNTGSMKSTAG